jgi:lon-related putative ATP-dependent protease
MSAPEPLSPDELYRHCTPDSFSFTTTAELPEITEFVGQERAIEAISFGLGMAREGYNIFVLGPQGTGRHGFALQHVQRVAATKPRPGDWCYVANFDDPQRPNALRLPAGRGRQFRGDLDKLIRDVRSALPAAFEGDDYRMRRQVIEDAFRRDQAAAFEALQREADAREIAVMQTPTGLAFAPKRKGEVMNPEEFQKLSEEEQRRIGQDIEELGRVLQQAMQGTPKRARAARQKIDELDREIASFTVASLIDDLVRAYADLPEVVQHLKALLADIVDNAILFLLPQGAGPAGERRPDLPFRTRASEQPAERRYGVNLFVECADCEGAPVIFEDHPTYSRLIGEVEHTAEMGALFTDFNLIRPGALHRANGGYVVLDAQKVLTQPYAWDALKRALRAKMIKIESLGQALSLISTVSLEPEPIPLSVKVALIGDRFTYSILQYYDPEFFDLFKVLVELDDEMLRTPENHHRMAQLIGTIARQERLKPFDRGSVARIIDESARQADDAERLSTRIRSIADLAREADYWAGAQGRAVVTRSDVQSAIDARIKRMGRIRERLQEEILRETILIDTTGARVGQVNGLSVLSIGELTFGRPSRITARLHVGAGRVIDIEREVALGGPLHSKGVLILSSYLAAHYAGDRPLSLSASLVFEQSYGGVEGDSASSAELYALVSALADVPLKQSFAVTGSVNQYGEVQAIGGVNEKIEGFFDICAARGLTGEQGVIIPAANVKHLMLRQDVIDSVKAKRFFIYAVKTINEGLEVLTGIPAGERRPDGTFPEGTVNERARLKLLEFAERRRFYAIPPREAGEGETEAGGRKT